ncbi:hypothetical protein Q73_11910 [Bacillus coahuilensis m2-6]|uniref:DUF1871 family protein n=1 Tax=Bacillus coahuilensis TaxID=408580 RepID=UPI00018508DC|nr:DUF1871 family protein [Bacillus coahuilensis]KUP06082.1 hypothetical protein Q73_11910 [Bacillus coahuilensis m2-6]
MNTAEMNTQLVLLLKKWDPFKIGPNHYDTEIADVIQATHSTEDSKHLAGAIQHIYEFSFEEFIPFIHCEVIAEKLLYIKNQASCSL